MILDMMFYMILWFGLEPVLIQQILINFEAILEKNNCFIFLSLHKSNRMSLCVCLYGSISVSTLLIFLYSEASHRSREGYNLHTEEIKLTAYALHLILNFEFKLFEILTSYNLPFVFFLFFTNKSVLRILSILKEH